MNGKKLVFSKLEKMRLFSESELRDLLCREIKKNKKFLEERKKSKEAKRKRHQSVSIYQGQLIRVEQNSMNDQNTNIEDEFKSIKISQQKLSLDPEISKEELYKQRIGLKKLSFSKSNLKSIKSSR